MTRIVIEDDHFLKVLAVVLDPATPEPHCRAVADFFAHDEPDFAGWCRRLQQKLPGLYPAEIVFAGNEAGLSAEIANADGIVVESLRVAEASLDQAGPDQANLDLTNVQKFGRDRAGHDRAGNAGARRLAIVHKYGTITSNIDVAACAARGIVVATLRRKVNVAVAEQAFALMIALAKRIGQLNGVVEETALRAAGLRIRPRQPRYIGYSNFAGVTGLKTLMGGTLGIVGMGEVGREVARRARAFEMRLVYHQRTPLAPELEQDFGASYLPFDDLMAQSDFVLVQLPLNEATRGLIGRDALARLKPGAVVVDVARAELIDRDALIETLAAGRLGGLGLDVLYSEPSDPGEPLLAYRGGNVILMPHTAVGSRANALADVETLCLNLCHAIAAKRHGCP